MLIYEALQSISDMQIQWTHIGDGIQFQDLKTKTINSRENIKINLLGRISNLEVIKYFQDKQVDGFINMSKFEGLPVSIMEAISFDVPVIATDVGGTSEIVNSQTGILLSNDPSVYEIACSIRKLKYSEYKPRVFWKIHFNAEKNTKKFIHYTLLKS